MPLNSGFMMLGIIENEVIFVPIDSEVEFYGQPCGIIVAKTMELANLATTKVNITYEKVQINRPIIPSVRLWCENMKLRAFENSAEYQIPANQQLNVSLIGQEKKIKGIKLILSVHFNAFERFCI